MKLRTKQWLTTAVLAATMTGSAWAADTVADAFDNATWPTQSTVVNTAGLTGYVNPAAAAIAKVDGTPITGSETFEAAAVPAQYVSGMSSEAVAPYLGKRITSVSVSQVPAADAERVRALLHAKVGDTVRVDTLQLDIATLGNLGVFARITPEFRTVPEGVALTYVVTPNPIVHGVVVTGNTIYPQEQLLQYLAIPQGKVLNTVAVGQRIQGIDAALNRDGYMLAHVDGLRVDDQGIVHIHITEGIVENFVVEGNTKTKPYVITREIIQEKGKPLNKFLARRSLQRIYNLGFFEDVNMRLLPGSTPDQVVMAIDVIEQKTGVITVGAGYSKSNGFSGLFEIGENNLRGTGDKVNVHWEFGGRASGANYAVTYTRPWVDDKATSLSATLMNRFATYTDYDEQGKAFSTYNKRTKGVSVSLGRQTGLFAREYLTLETMKDMWVTPTNKTAGDYSGILYNNPKFEQVYPNYIGRNFGRTNSITFQRVFDSRDNVYDPKHGKRFSYSLQWAGHGLGGNFNFYKISAEARTYRDLGHDHVLAFRLGAGIIVGTPGYSQLFAVGGSNTLRGYEDDQFRGKKFYNATVEYRLPLFNKVQGVVFIDAGDAWDVPQPTWYNSKRGIHIGYGPGLRIQTPIGPVRLDYGFGSKGGKFTFAFGGQF